MSTIPGGLRIDLMRERMEDKATINCIGGLYVGGTTRVTFNNGGSATVQAYATQCLAPGTAGLPLVSNGSNAVPSYQKLTAVGIMDRAVTAAKLGAGTVVSSDGVRKVLNIQGSDDGVLTISFRTSV